MDGQDLQDVECEGFLDSRESGNDGKGCGGGMTGWGKWVGMSIALDVFYRQGRRLGNIMLGTKQPAATGFPPRIK